ncbi:hypothetical protein Shyd_16680 [Streptomyces hydrogenans]|uniref:FTP domain-containing protein n=1 Tax=Streptomyces hydrogenans TaxID=1873719 RepID=A0ABQ3P5K1_9ACTN|nr:hypothetical protein [Streptomyces hydrogenans]GHI20297.1 hypothetical protein Shyd_16680 [Streptomyces hydrogenans]
MTADTRDEAIRTAGRNAAATARELGLGPDERLVAKDVLIDADGARHVRYDRTYRGLPVIGGDLVVHLAEDGTITGSDLAHQGAIRIAGTTPKLTAADASAKAVKHARHVKKAKAGSKDSNPGGVRGRARSPSSPTVRPSPARARPAPPRDRR